MDRNQLKICSDPYRRRIEYFWYEENDTWTDMKQIKYSPLNDERFTSSSLSHNAYEIFTVIAKKLYNPMLGLRIIFEGMDEDYAELSSIKELYFSQFDIELERGPERLRPPKEVMEQMESSYGRLTNFFQEHPNKEAEAIIAKYTDAVKPEIAVCVMGLYSSGKSSFVNSLIGQEILPSDSDPATAKIYKIRESETHAILFRFQGEDYRIEYHGTQWTVNQDPDSEIMKLIAKTITDNAAKTEEQTMYWTIYALNDFAKEEGMARHDGLVKCAEKLLDSEALKAIKNDDEKIDQLLKKYRIQELVEKEELAANKLDNFIEVYVDFVHSNLPLDKFKFVIYDTPGSNSVMFREYADILKESLKQQTNGLPVFVTNPDRMDETDNNEIMEIINELGGSLDVSNMMLVVNKSDEKSRKTLQRKLENKENLVLTKWKANRVYFVSSILGLGGKKANPDGDDQWIDEDYYSIFDEKEDKFRNSDNKFYLRLFEYNMLPHDSYERMKKKTESIPESDLLLWNSGIPFVEEEIGVFADKYAIYNKCAQAYGYLMQAATMVKKEAQATEQSAKELQASIEIGLDDKEKDLIKKLNDECDNKKTEYVSNYLSTAADAIAKQYLDDRRIEKVIDDILVSCPGKTDYDKLKPYNEKIEASIKADLLNYSKETSKKTEEYWRKCEREFRDYLLKIVAGTTDLTPEQKEVFGNNVLNVATVASVHKTLNITNTSAVTNKGKKLLGRDLTHISRTESLPQYREALKTDIANNNKKAMEDNERSFKAWGSQVINKLVSVIYSFNSDLVSMTDNLDKQKELIDIKLAQHDFIVKEIAEIENLLDFC